MPKKIFSFIMLVQFLVSFSVSADEFDLLREERIGNLRIGSSEGEVKKTIHCAPERGPELSSPIDRPHHQRWKYVEGREYYIEVWEYIDCGITLDMVSEKKGALKSIDYIRVVSPSTLTTKEGIRIGSTEQEVMKAYMPYWNRDDSALEFFVAGSIKGGLIFQFNDGKVSEIILGAADDFALLRGERIGNLRIGSSEGEVKKTIHCTLKRGPERSSEIDNAYHQGWEYRDCGITLGMVSEKKGARKSINYIRVVSPSRLQTKRGIRIGSTEQETMKAYMPFWNREDSNSEQFVAGSVYGGLVFYLDNGKVNEIILGATAE